MSTHRGMAEQALRGAVALHVLDPLDLRLLYQNALSLKLFGKLRDFAAFEALRDTTAESLRPHLNGVVRLHTRSGPRSFFLQPHQRDHRLLHLLTDITALETELDDLFRGLQVDPLTNTLNRRTLMYTLVRELSRAERDGAPLQLLLAIVEKQVETGREFGRETADRVMIHVGDLVASSIRPTDILGRYEADCFALILAGTDAAGGRWVAERTRRLIEAAPLELNGRRMTVVVHIGIADFVKRDTPASILSRAREDLERAKAAIPSSPNG